MPMDDVDLTRMNQVLRHRLRNVASGVKGAMTYLATELEERLSAEEREYFPLVIKECDALTELTARLNGFFDEVEPGTAEAIGELMADIEQQARAAFPQSSFTFRSETGDDATCVLRAKLLRDALFEIIVNAAEATAEGAVTVTWAHDAERLSVNVEDGGWLDDTTDLDELARPFFTTRARHLGLGLPLAKKLLALAGGSIELSRTARAGLAVKIQAPLDT